LRDSGDGKSLGLAKVIAGLTGIGTEEILRRACYGHHDLHTQATR
jgi:hypothetical protein